MIPYDRVINYQLEALHFGDKRLNLRCKTSFSQMEKRGFNKSFPEIFQDVKSLKRFYELMNNEKVTLDRFNDGYLNGLIDYFSIESNREGHDYLFNYQDTTFGKYNNRKIELGYTETEKSNGLIIHSGILTGSDYIPLGIAHQLQIKRDRAFFGKKAERATKDFEQKESYKWVDGLRWAHRFNEFVKIPIVQVNDRESDIADFFNMTFSLKQFFLVRSMHNRKIEESEQKLYDFIENQPVKFETERTLIDADGKKHTVICSVKYALVQFENVDAPIWAIYLKANNPPQNMEETSWTLLTNLGLNDQDEMVIKCIDAYTKRWRTTEDFHKCLKSGCSIEQRQFRNAEAMQNMISLMSIAAVRLLRTRHMSELNPHAPVSIVLDEMETKVAMALAQKFIKPIDLDYCQPQTSLWWTLLLGRMGGHLGYSQKGLPGWITLSKGWQYFQNVIDGINLSKNIFGFSP